MLSRRSRRSHLHYLGVVVLVALCAVAVFSQDALAQARLLGETRLSHREGDLDFLTLSPCANLVAVKLRAIRGAAEINLLIVTYGNNEVDRLRGRHRIPQGGETRWLDLRGGRRCVKSIAVVGDTEKSVDRTILQLWGR